MKALTVCQPYAELIASGAKLIENRSWETDYRGPLAIHAGKSRAWFDDEDQSKYVFGAIVAVADLVACLELPDPEQGSTRYSMALTKWREAGALDATGTIIGGEHANGPWCWILKNIKRMTPPIPYKGAQGLWNCPSLKGSEIPHA